MSSIREARSLWEQALAWHRAGELVALLTLVHVQGSAYRRPGAKMVMAANGHMQGTLSGGCLEGDLFLHAEAAMKSGRASLHHYDLTEDDMWGLGIGCKGQVDVWVEPVDVQEPFWQRFGRALAVDAPLVFAAQLPEGGRFVGRPGEEPERKAPDFPWVDLQDLVRRYETTGSQGGWWWDLMRPPERLVISGAGHDAEPLARLAHQAGFDVVILDSRPHLNNPERFPDAFHRVESADQVSPSQVSESYWVIMNHHQLRDEAALTLASSARPRFLGVLGPRVRTEEMLAKTGLDRHALPFHSPVGLDIGAENPSEVALSIVAELMAARSGGSGGPLHGRERIHR